MARKTKIFVVNDQGRDRGKVFHLTEMSAAQAFKWGWSAARLLIQSGFIMSDEIAAQGIAAMWLAGFMSMLRVDHEEAQPLLAELMSCVQLQPDPMNTFLRPPTSDDIEEVLTIYRLHEQALTLSINFSEIAANLGLSHFGKTSSSVQEEPQAATAPMEESSNTPTFQQPSARPSPRAASALSRHKRS